MFNNYEIVEYTHSLPFQIQNFTGRTIQDDRGDIKDVLEHWHQEIEIVYTFEGHCVYGTINSGYCAGLRICGCQRTDQCVQTGVWRYAVSVPEDAYAKERT